MSATVTGLQALMLSADPESDLRAAYLAKIADARLNPTVFSQSDRLRVLLVGYSGACNTGADLRTGEIIRHLRSGIGDARLELGILIVGPQPLPDWGPITKEHIAGFAPDAVFDLCARYDAVVVCEGSVFTSTFSDSLATMLTAFLGMASALGKPAVAWGAEADHMSPAVERFVREAASGALIVARNEASAQRLSALSLTVEQGTDTGWTFDDTTGDAATTQLRALGWDGSAPILAIAPTNPFRWPLIADAERALFASLTGEAPPDHHSGILFYQPVAESEQRCSGFLQDIADAITGHVTAHMPRAFCLVVGMEMNDRSACDQLAGLIGAPAIVAGETPPQMLVAVLRRAALLVSARYHAILLSMQAGVPAVGLAYDQRVMALMAEAGLPELALDVQLPDLRIRLTAALDRISCDGTIGPTLSSFAERQRYVQHAMAERITAYLIREHR
jgi:polysaccharide pyruvyl transferase WcaK-like protein